MVEMLKVQTADSKITMNKEDLSSTIETLEILSDKELREQIKKSEQNMNEGRVYEIKDKKDLKKLLGLEDVQDYIY